MINYNEDAAAALRGVEARMPRSEAAPRGQGGGSPNAKASEQSRTMADDSTKAASPTISVPSSAAEPITVERDGLGVGLTIMGSNVKKSKSVPFNADTVIYPRTESGASTAVTVAPRADDTMIETYTIIHEASAPEEYWFRMALQPGERLVAPGENSAVVGADGIAMTTIDAPWAVAAVGVRSRSPCWWRAQTS